MGHIAGWVKEIEVSGFIVSGRTEVGLRYIRACSHAAITNVIRVTNLSPVTGFTRVSIFFSVTHYIVVNCRISDSFNSPVAVTVEGGGV